MNNIESIDNIVSKAEELGWIVKSFKKDDYYRFSKRMGNSTVFFNKGIEGETPKELMNNMREECIEFDLPVEANCWVNDKGIPSDGSPYKNLEETYEAFVGFEEDLLNLYLSLDTSANKSELILLKHQARISKSYNHQLDEIHIKRDFVPKNGFTMKIDRDMLIFGMRYALGRQTFAPSTAIENIKRNIDKLNNNTIDIMIRDIEEHPGSLGMECDKLTWMNFKDYLINVKNKRNNI